MELKYGGDSVNKKAKKAVIIGGTAAGISAVAAVTAYATTKTLIKIALDRKEPESLKKIQARIYEKKENDFIKALNEAGKRLSEKPSETIRIVSHDGKTLVGHWIPQKNAKRVLIAMHGWRSTWSGDFGIASDAWEENGCSVLYAEQRGQDKSEGNYMGFGITERFDCLDWIAWVRERCGTDIPIYLFGVSMGATTVLMASCLPLPENVHGIIADCGFTSPHEIWKYVVNHNLHLGFRIRGRIAEKMFMNMLHAGSDKYSTLDALKSSKVPVLFIHGSDDRFVPVEMTYRNYKACVSPKKLLIVPGADHGMSYYISKDEYEKSITDFWNMYDNLSMPISKV